MAQQSGSCRCTFHGCDGACPGSGDGNEAVHMLVEPGAGLLHDKVQGHQAAQRVPNNGDLSAVIAVHRMLHKLRQIRIEAHLQVVTGMPGDLALSMLV